MTSNYPPPVLETGGSSAPEPGAGSAGPGGGGSSPLMFHLPANYSFPHAPAGPADTGGTGGTFTPVPPATGGSSGGSSGTVSGTIHTPHPPRPARYPRTPRTRIPRPRTSRRHPLDGLAAALATLRARGGNPITGYQNPTYISSTFSYDSSSTTGRTSSINPSGTPPVHHRSGAGAGSTSGGSGHTRATQPPPLLPISSLVGHDTRHSFAHPIAALSPHRTR